MSFIIALHIGEGLVMASDSRITYDTTTSNPDGTKTIERGVHFNNSSPKTFLTPANVGVSYCGDATIQKKPITGYIERFIDEHKEDDVEAIAKKIEPYFTAIDENLDISFHIGGYKKEGETLKQKLYHVNTKTKKVSEQDTSMQCAIWSGQTDVLSRLINPAYYKNKDGEYKDLPYYPILWQYFTLQDAIDFARYAVKTTIDTMNFQSRIKSVGGPIDILVIKPTEAIWIEKRQLH